MSSVDNVLKQSIPLKGAGKIVLPLPHYCSLKTGFSGTVFPQLYTLYTEIAKIETSLICQVPVCLHYPSYHIEKCMCANDRDMDHTSLLFLWHQHQEVIATLMSSDMNIFSTLFWILYFSQKRHCCSQQLHFSCNLLQNSIRLSFHITTSTQAHLSLSPTISFKLSCNCVTEVNFL